MKATEQYFAVVLFSYTRLFLLWSLYKKFFSMIIQVKASMEAPSHTAEGTVSFLVSKKEVKIAIFIEWFRSLPLEL